MTELTGRSRWARFAFIISGTMLVSKVFFAVDAEIGIIEVVKMSLLKKKGKKKGEEWFYSPC